MLKEEVQEEELIEVIKVKIIKWKNIIVNYLLMLFINKFDKSLK